MGVRCAHILSAEMLDDVSIGQDVPCQLLLLLLGLEDQAPFAESDDVLLHQVQVHGLHELLGRQKPGEMSHPLAPTHRAKAPKAKHPGMHRDKSVSMGACLSRVHV